MQKFGPRGWTDGQVTTRFVSAAPASYDPISHSTDCVISSGTSVKRFYGTEVLRIDRGAVNLERVRRGVAPLLDSHQSNSVSTVLGRIDRAWIENGKLLGVLTFNATEAGCIAEGMVARSEISGISAGYRVDEWEIADEDGILVDPNRASFDDNLTFTATRWELLECSLVSVPADATASIRSRNDSLAHIRQRMIPRQAMHEAQQRAGKIGSSYD
jgi:phage head maturation protease